MELWKKSLYIIGIAQFVGFATLYFAISFFPLYIRTLGVVNPGEASIWSGFLIGIGAFFVAVSGPIWGNIGDRYGRKFMIERVFLCNIVIVMLMGFVRNVWELLVLRSLQGALGGFSAASIALVTSITPRAEMGFALGLNQFALTAGTALGPLLGGYLVDAFSFRTVFVIMACILLVATLLVRFFVYEKFTPPTETIRSESFFTTLKHLLSQSNLLSMMLVNLLVQFSLLIVVPIIPLFIHSLDTDATRITTITGVIIAAGGVSSAISAIYLGRVGDRIGHKKVLIICSLGAAVANILQVFISSSWEFLIFRIIAGAFMGGMLPCANAMINNLIPSEQKGTAFGVATSFSMFGIVLGPISGGLLGASPIGYRGVFAVTAALLLLTALWIKVVIQDLDPKADKEFCHL